MCVEGRVRLALQVCQLVVLLTGAFDLCARTVAVIFDVVTGFCPKSSRMCCILRHSESRLMMSCCFADYLGGGYISAFLLILFSEIGDKTFFIAVLLSLQNSRSLIFTGTFGALAIMTVISVAIGQSFHELDGLIPENAAQFPLDDILAAALLIVFGIQTLLVNRSPTIQLLEYVHMKQPYLKATNVCKVNMQI